MQNGPECNLSKLKLKIFLGEYISRLPALETIGFLRLVTLYKIPSAPPSTECLQMPLLPCTHFTLVDTILHYG